jgi:hypothetical protein
VSGDGNEGVAQTHCRKSVLKKMSHLSRLLRSDAMCCVVVRCVVRSVGGGRGSMQCVVPRASQ